jgi:two-component system sensor histidine kinase KdpD
MIRAYESHRRKDPDALLRQAQAEERARHRGSLKIFLGYASGVGKSRRLFDEGRRRQARGEDVVVGAVQTTTGAGAREDVRDLEVIPTVTSGGVPIVDVASIVKRHPGVCLIDGLAYDNPPGSRHRTRYEDIEALLGQGISVMTSINLEHIDEQQEFVRSVTGTAPLENVPQAFLAGADEIVVVDAPPDVASGGQGTVAGPAADQRSRLRERTLLLTADVVDRQLEAYLELHGLQSSWGTQERILVCMTPRANAATMLASGRRNAGRFHGELFAVYVNQFNLTPEDRLALERNATLARAQHASVEVLDGRDPIATILAYARKRGITQIFVGHNLRRNWRTRLRGSPLDQLIRDAEGMDVRVFPH